MALARDESLSAEQLAVWRMSQRAQARVTRHLEEISQVHVMLAKPDLTGSPAQAPAPERCP